MYNLLVSDVAGTVVSDDGVVLACFEDAIRVVAPESWENEGNRFLAYAQETMGQSKGAVFSAMLGDSALAVRANEEFDRFYRERLDEVSAFDGVEEFFHELAQQGIRIALNTGFTRVTMDALLETFGWADLIDFSVTPAEAGSGRPHPDMIHRSMHLAGVNDPQAVMVVGDTVSDIESGRAAGAGMVVSVLTGAHSRETLEAAHPDHIVDDITGIRSLL